MPTFTLGRDQTVTIDGAVSEGTREVEVDLSGKTLDLTGLDHSLASTMVLAVDATAKLLVYDVNIYDALVTKLGALPPQKVSLSFSGIGSADFVVEKISAKQPIDGVSSWEISLKTWAWG